MARRECEDEPVVSWGVCFGPAWNTSLGELVPWARAAEAAGFNRVATGEFHSDPITWAALLAAATHRVPIATTIASIAQRHPTVVAEAVAAIRDVHGDRIELGLGVSHPSLVEQELGLPQPDLADLEAYVAAVRSTLAGEEGRFGRYRVPAHERTRRTAGHPPILVAALGLRAVTRAATYADGVILTWAPQDWIARVVERVRAQDAATGRSTRVWAVLPTFLHDEPERAQLACAAALQPYLQLPSYASMLSTALGDLDRVAAAAHATSPAQVLDRLGGAVLERIAAVGGPDHVRTAIDAHTAIGVDEVLLYPLSTGAGWAAAVEACISRCPPAP